MKYNFQKKVVCVSVEKMKELTLKTAQDRSNFKPGDRVVLISTPSSSQPLGVRGGRYIDDFVVGMPPYTIEEVIPCSLCNQPHGCRNRIYFVGGHWADFDGCLGFGGYAHVVFPAYILEPQEPIIFIPRSKK